MFLYIVNDGKGKKKKHNIQSLFIRNITNILLRYSHISGLDKNYERAYSISYLI